MERQKDINEQRQQSLKDKLQDKIEDTYGSLSKEKKLELINLFWRYRGNPEKYSQELSRFEKVIFKKKPPTGLEFLDPKNGWIPQKEIWPHVKQDFLDIIDGKKNYFQLAFYGSSRLGKSFLAVLLMMYTIVYMHHLRDPALTYGLSSGTRLAMYIISFNKSKPKEIYLDPLYDYLENAPRYERVIQHKQVKIRQREVGMDKIIWSSADISSSGHLTLASGLTVRTGNKNPNDIIGANVIQSYISEIAFFIDEAGASEDKIFELYTNAYSRIRATVGKDYLTWVFLDSSANYEDSKIERHIINNLQYSDDTFFRWRWQWGARPWDFKEYYKGLQNLGIKDRLPTTEENKILLEKGLVFQVITGNGNIPAKLVQSEYDLKDVPESLIDYPPTDVLEEYRNNLIKNIKDIGGKPTSNESKFIQNETYINNMFDDRLKNIEGGLVIDSSSTPENLIWPMIEPKFFEKDIQGRNVIYRAKNEPRFVAVDIATSAHGDLYGFCMGHLEYSRTLKEKMFVVDFAFPFMPGKEGINLSAVDYFISDLVSKGNVYIHMVDSDTFQSSHTIQNLNRIGVEANKQSVDRTLDPYLRFSTALMTKTVKAGKNIFLKNNLKCLERVRNDKGKEKIDHTKGKTQNKYNGDFENSLSGIHAKDVSDAVTSACFSAFTSEIYPTTIWEDENKSLEIVDEKDENLQKDLEIAYNILKNRY